MSNRSTSAIIRDKVSKVPSGKLIDYKSFGFTPDKMEAVAQTLYRLSKKGEIQRLSKGVYYKPEMTAFGFLKPSENTILKRYLKDGYITGTSAYNKLGLTTQTSSVVRIATENRKSPIAIGGLTINFVESKARINKSTKPLLPMLDAIKDIKRIPDADINSSLRLLASRAQKLGEEQRSMLAKIAMNYNAATRAVTGALLENAAKELNEQLKESLNPLTKFKLGVDSEVLPNKSNWNIA